MPYKNKAIHRIHMRVYMRDYRKKNREWWNACKKRYRKNNLEKARQMDRDWRKKNPEKCRATYLRWRDKDPIKTKLLWRKALAKRRKSGYLSIKIIQEIYEKNIHKFGTLTCCLCFKPIVFGNDSIDHIIPLSKGGTHIKSNLQIAHILCNRKKGNRQGVIPIRIEVVK